MAPVKIFKRREFGVVRFVLFLDGNGRVEGLFDHTDDVTVSDLRVINKTQDGISCGSKNLRSNCDHFILLWIVFGQHVSCPPLSLLTSLSLSLSFVVFVLMVGDHRLAKDEK